MAGSAQLAAGLARTVDMAKQQGSRSLEYLGSYPVVTALRLGLDWNIVKWAAAACILQMMWKRVSGQIETGHRTSAVGRQLKPSSASYTSNPDRRGSSLICSYLGGFGH